MDESLFVLRRAWLVGRCRRADIDAVFDTRTSPNRASKIIKESVARWRDHLFYSPRRGVFPNARASLPEEVRADRILDLLAQGAGPAETGLLSGDATPFLRPDPKPSRAMTPVATQAVLDAALHDTALGVLYVGLRRGEKARWRTLWPRAMEFTGLHWQLHAQDLDDAGRGFPIKTFLLARILETRPATDWKAPSGFRPLKVVRAQSHLRVWLSDELTSDQQAVVRNQFDIQGGRMTWPHSGLHAFRREFTNASVPPDVVWPVILRADELD